MNLDLSLLCHQREFIEDNKTRNLALIGGYGCGKTKALAIKLIILSLLNAGYEGIALSPTYQMSIKNLIPTIESELQEQRIRYEFKKTDMVFHIHFGKQTTKLHILAAEHYKRAAGLNCAFFGVDEADLLGGDLFAAAWQMLSSRLRRGKVFQGVAVSTPEGFNGCYKFWVEDIQNKPELSSTRRIIYASTYDNPFLPKEYIEGLEAQYPPALIKAYLNGQFVNLAGRPVYWCFDPERHLITETLAHFPQHVLHIGVDYNKGINASVVHVIKNNQSYAVDEIYGQPDTQSLANEIKTRFPWHVANNCVRFYPDASGFEGTQNLKRNFPEFAPDGQPNFRQPGKNGPVEKRIAAVNEKYGAPGRTAPMAFVNRQKCPELYKGLTQQTYNKSEQPDKESGIDHALDGHGYFLVRTWPATGHVTARID